MNKPLSTRVWEGEEISFRILDSGRVFTVLRKFDRYFCVRGFHVTTPPDAANSVEMCVAVSALLRESEVKALGVTWKSDNRVRRDADGY